MTAQVVGMKGYMTMSYIRQNSVVPVIDMQQAQVCHN
jgi:hypothetical protein